MSTSIQQDPGNSDHTLISWNSDELTQKGSGIAVLAVHGRGQNPSFMQEQSRRFGVPGVRYYAPRAPEDTWYPLGFTAPLEDNEPKLSESLGIMGQALKTILDDGYSFDQIVLWGFSQGACLITQYVLGSPETYGGLLIFTGGYLGPEQLANPDSSPFHEVPILLRSIDKDPWVPQSRVRETAEYFKAAGATVNLQIDEGSEHGITEEAVIAGAKLLSSLQK